MNMLRKAIHSIRKRGFALSRPRLGQVLASRAVDFQRDYPADGLTPERLMSILREADAGSPEQAMQLYEQMEEKDPHLYSVASTRRLGLTGLSWEIVSAAEFDEHVDRALADEAAAYCRQTLASMESWDDVLQHLSLAIGRGIAVAELVWELDGGGHRLVDVVPVTFTRLVFDERGGVRILTDGEPVHGMTLPPNKFIVHAPHAASGHPMRGGLLRVCALAYLGKHFALKDWLVFAEVFGMPVRIARYEPTASADEKRELLRMLQAMGSDAAAVFSKAVEVELLQSNGGRCPPPFEAICEFLNRELSKAWLGQTLTVDTAGQTGTLATAAIHNEVRHDLREDDLRREARTIRRDVLRPLTHLRFGREAPVPHFRRALDRPRDLRELADVMAVAVERLGMRVPSRWAHETLGIPLAGENEAWLNEGGVSRESGVVK